MNGLLQEQKHDGDYNFVETSLNFTHTERYIETLGGYKHAVVINPDSLEGNRLSNVIEFPHKESCVFSSMEMSCTVPAGHYFLLGDNRDGSRDSRFWGFVPDNMIVGKAFMIWMNFNDLKRIGLNII